jgi:hypothetical protein
MQLEDVVCPLEVIATLRNRHARPLKHATQPHQKIGPRPTLHRPGQVVPTLNDASKVGFHNGRGAAREHYRPIQDLPDGAVFRRRSPHDIPIAPNPIEGWDETYRCTEQYSTSLVAVGSFGIAAEFKEL